MKDEHENKTIQFWIEGKKFETTNKRMTVQGILGLIGLSIERYTLAVKIYGGYHEYKEDETIEIVENMHFQPFDHKTAPYA